MKSTSKTRKPVHPGTQDASRAVKPGKTPEADAELFDAGVTTKDSRYLARIVEAIASDKKHPRHAGIGMQAHHAISATGMHRSSLANETRKFGYDINLLENLVFLPCTLQGACHLGVQPHRGNHTAPADQDNYKNDVQPMDYHDLVAQKIKNLQMGLTTNCPGFMGGARELEARLKVKHELDELSAKLIDLIQLSPRKAPLTQIATSFQPGSVVGCGCVDSTTTHSSLVHCSVNRNHFRNQGKGQRSENITFESNGKYKLQAKR